MLILRREQVAVFSAIVRRNFLCSSTEEIRACYPEIAARTKTKVKWALGELKSIQRIYREKGSIAFEMRGSFAGAFGMPQFLPSS